MPPKRIFLVNFHSARNAGDAALLQMTLRTLSSVFPESYVQVATENPELYCPLCGEMAVPSLISPFRKRRPSRQTLWQICTVLKGVILSIVAALWFRRKKSLPPWLPEIWLQILQPYAYADLIVSCPGNIFATTGRFGGPLLFSAFITAYGLILKKPLYVMPQSIGPLHHNWERLLIRLLYSRAEVVFVREPVSLRLAEKLGIDRDKLYLVPDLAFAFPSASPEEAINLLARHNVNLKRPKIGVTVINRLLSRIDKETWNRYENSMAYALSQFITHYGGSVVFFPQVTGPTEREDDRIAAHRIIEKMKRPEHAILVEEQPPPGVLKAMYGLMDAFVATRMHSAIFAISMGVPTLFIEYLHKTRGVAEMLNLENWVLPLEAISENNLWKMLEQMWIQKEILRTHLEQVVPTLIERINLVEQILVEKADG